jgi:phage terminase large subunit-like protein
MVKATIRAVDPTVSFKAVTASRGKAVRAEPIAALYEQGRVHHVGTFRELEDEMTDWAPGDPTSPDRMDALVWALTDLSNVGKWAFT